MPKDFSVNDSLPAPKVELRFLRTFLSFTLVRTQMGVFYPKLPLRLGSAISGISDHLLHIVAQIEQVWDFRKVAKVKACEIVGISN